MSNLAKIWNDNELPFEQVFKEEKIRIPAKSYIEMEYDEAVAFKSYPFPMKFDGMGQQLKESYKMLRVDGKPDGGNRVLAYKCQADGSLHGSQDALNSYVQEKFVERLEVSDENPKKTGKKL